jgi:hypothetical protein
MKNIEDCFSRSFYIGTIEIFAKKAFVDTVSHSPCTFGLKVPMMTMNTSTQGVGWEEYTLRPIKGPFPQEKLCSERLTEYVKLLKEGENPVTSSKIIS